MKATQFLFLSAVSVYFVLAGSGTTFSFSQDQKKFEAFQAELLSVAFETASAIPAKPHIVNRSRAQEGVIATLLELDQPEEALTYVEGIENWRRGTGHADIGFYYAQKGEREKAMEQLKIAGEIAVKTADWPKDRIRAHVARGYSYLGEYEKAAEVSQNIDVNEAVKINAAMAMTATTESYKDQYTALKKMAESDLFDVKQQGILAAIELWNSFYTDKGKRKSLEKIVTKSWTDLGGYLQINYLFRMADYALAHQDQAKAMELLKKAQAIHDGATWQPRFGIPLMARLAELYSRAGDKEMAKTVAAEAEGVYAESRLDIVNIDRAGLLAPLAGAYQVMGESQEAVRLYSKALEEAIVNPNSKPRAEDIALICRSMAVAKVEPTPQLWEKIKELKENLGEPW